MFVSIPEFIKLFGYTFTRPQRHRMAAGGRDLWVYLAQPLLQQGHPEQGVQAHTQVVAEGLQWGDSTASRQPVPVLWHPHSTEVLLVFWGHLLFQFMPIASCPQTRHHWKDMAPSSLCLPFRYFYRWMRSPCAYSSLVPALSASPHRKGAPVPQSSVWPFMTNFPTYTVFSCTGEHRTVHSAAGVASPVMSRERGRNTSLNLLTTHCLIQNPPGGFWAVLGVTCSWQGEWKALGGVSFSSSPGTWHQAAWQLVSTLWGGPGGSLPLCSSCTNCLLFSDTAGLGEIGPSRGLELYSTTALVWVVCQRQW